MLILLFISMLFVSPLISYYWIWKQLNQQDHIPNFSVAIRSLLGTYFFPNLIILSLILNRIYFTDFPIIWGILLFWGLLAPLSLAIYLFFAKQSSSEKRKLAPNLATKRLFLIGLIFLANFVPLFAYTTKISACYYQSLEEAKPLIQALEIYHRENGFYPASFPLGDLDPLPTPVCQQGFYLSSNSCDFVWYGNGLLESTKGHGDIELYLFVWFFGGGYWGECYRGDNLGN